MNVPPWLDHLRTDRRGIPVPYVNAYGSLNDTHRWRLRHDSLVRGPGLFYEDHGDTPNFTAQNIGRQRECIIGGLCQVCGHPVPWSRRFLVISEQTIQRIDFEGREVDVVTEPWLDERCATFAVRYCPALVRRSRDNGLVLVKVTSKRDCAVIVSNGWVDGPLKAETQAVMPAMWAKIALPGRRS